MRVWVIAVVVCVSISAAASPPRVPELPAPDPRAAMTDYFGGEVTGGWVLVGMGAAGLTAGGILLADGGDRAQGASYVTFGFGAAHLVAGVYVNIASRIRRRVYAVAIDKAPDIWVAAERRRMSGVSTQFLVLKIAEVALIAGGGTMAAIGRSSDRPQLEGAGYALAAEAAATLVFDIVASRRASRYRERLRRSANLSADVANRPVWIVGATLQF